MGYFSIPFPTFAELAEPARGLSERETRSMERGGGGHRQTDRIWKYLRFFARPSRRAEQQLLIRERGNS